ncbi:uncharacterized protein LOC133785332 [Humulus lupulus]|uniref:uncharacterized protein LOC133785332 n=1 Tax=Humulus lupulus TaxID=3486 RepID=UPI002B406C4A|nr:uncharacterized protein LOC133785332 [Humulus lupulus]
MGVPKEFCLTIIYGRNTIEERKRLWQAMFSLLFPVQPWLVAGDFNAMFDFDDRVGDRPITDLEVEDARNWRASCLMSELHRIGAHYTWSNKQMEGSHIFSKLDRALSNEAWVDAFPNFEARFNWDVLSDHCYCIIKIKLNRLKMVLTQFNKLQVGDVTVRYSAAKEKFQHAQFKLQQDPLSPGFQQAEHEANIEFVRKSKMYESFLQQRSKITWLGFGDENTSYFIASLKQTTACNRITAFFDEHGQIIDCYDAVVNHFKGFMGSPSPTITKIQQDCFQHGTILNLDQQLSLVKPFMKRDVKFAMFSIHSVNSPGPDGFGSGFFKSMWKDLGDEISTAILKFFESGQLPTTLNISIISLIPKVETPSTTADYRPIACCNTLYKCISKMLCVRLANVLPLLIHQNKGAFIQHRSLTHNIFILQDLLKGSSRNNISTRCLIKMDLSKAYDSIDWYFLEDLLNAYCFPSRFIQWIMVFLKGASYYLLLNGRLYGGFSGMKAEFVNLCFADDLIIFFKGSFRSVQLLHAGFTKFSQDSSLTMNLSKSHIYFGGVHSDEKKRIMECLNIEEGYFLLKYLGLFLRPTKWKEIDRLCRNFLWGAKGNRSKLHLSSWEQVYLPKSMGGIGFKEGSKWNATLMAKYIWAISTKQDSLWVKWVETIYLKGKKFLLYSLQSNVSWYWRKLIKLRDAFSHDTLLASVTKGKLNTSILYNQMIHKEKASFAKVVWCKMSTPKHRFIIWQAVLGHLLTRDNLIKCHVQVDSSICPVCEMGIASHAHLFFDCSFSQKVMQ